MFDEATIPTPSSTPSSVDPTPVLSGFELKLLRVASNGRALPGLISAGRRCQRLPEILRRQRQQELEELWRQGHRRIVDEVLLADVIARFPAAARNIVKIQRRTSHQR